MAPHRIALDANCFIDALAIDLPSGESVRRLLRLGSSGDFLFFVSRHTIAELEAGSEKDGGAAIALASTASLLPYRPIGEIDDLVGAIQDLPGTFDDWREWSARSDMIRKDLKAAASIRDLGALYDAIAANCGLFLTSDSHLCAPAIALLIATQWKIDVMTPGAAEQTFVAPEV